MKALATTVAKLSILYACGGPSYASATSNKVFKVNNENRTAECQICLKLKIKLRDRHLKNLSVALMKFWSKLDIAHTFLLNKQNMIYSQITNIISRKNGQQPPFRYLWFLWYYWRLECLSYSSMQTIISQEHFDSGIRSFQEVYSLDDRNTLPALLHHETNIRPICK